MNTFENCSYHNRVNRNAYVVTSCSVGKGHDNETKIEGVFSIEERAKSWIDRKVLEWLKNQGEFDPKHEISGDVKYGTNEDGFYVIIDYKENGKTVSYTAYDYSIYDYI